jgi:hypothetical protein
MRFVLAFEPRLFCHHKTLNVHVLFVELFHLTQLCLNELSITRMYTHLSKIFFFFVALRMHIKLNSNRYHIFTEYHISVYKVCSWRKQVEHFAYDNLKFWYLTSQ